MAQKLLSNVDNSLENAELVPPGGFRIARADGNTHLWGKREREREGKKEKEKPTHLEAGRGKMEQP